MKKLLITTIFVLAGTCAFAYSFDAGDGKLDVYASIRAFAASVGVDGAETVAGERAHSQFMVGAQGNSRFGARWTRGDFFGNIEYGLAPAANAGRTDIILRYMYGDYKFAGGDLGKIRIGQIPSIAHSVTYFNRKLNGDNALQGFGTITEARRIGVNYELSGLSVSLLTTRQDAITTTGLYTAANYANVEFVEVMPRIELSYTILPEMQLKVGASYLQTAVMANNLVSGENDKYYGLTAYHLMAAAKPKIGDNMYVAATGFYAVNAGLYNMVSIASGFTNGIDGNALNPALPVLKKADKAEFEDTKIFGGAVALGIVLSPEGTVEIGFGYQSASNSLWKDNTGDKYDQNGMSVYANYSYRVSPNFWITPEISYTDTGKNIAVAGNNVGKAVNDTKVTQVGVQLRMDI